MLVVNVMEAVQPISAMLTSGEELGLHASGLHVLPKSHLFGFHSLESVALTTEESEIYFIARKHAQ